MEKVHTSVRLKQIMKERNLKQVDVLNLAQPICTKYGERLGKNDLSQYVSGKTEPGQRKLFVLGIALNVNPSWLMGLDVPKESTITFNNVEEYKKADALSDIYLKIKNNPTFFKLVEKLNELNDDQLEAVYTMLSTF